ncbi:VOC family protein [Sporosarcina sp. OR05]|uniref:VOC family protein n=1 Tax=Sporosarcina sp. OR05 TaxID=2969819 RepID=UPI00352B16EE
MDSPIETRISTIFIPVSDVAKARDWYCGLLGVPADGEIVHGHIYVISLENVNLVLDSKVFEKFKRDGIPRFHFDVLDIEAAYEYVIAKEVTILTEIENGHWFNISDPDGNVLMICQC